MRALVECEKGTKGKFELELTEEGITFKLNRVLKHKWVASYGYIPKTLQGDSDELDTYILGKKLRQGEMYEIFPLCLVYVLDQGQIDNKLICGTLTTSKHNLKRQMNKVRRFIAKYKRGCIVLGLTFDTDNIRFELAKCKALYQIFKKGGK